MGRRILILLIFLLAGAVVNVGVAWGCWLSGPRWNLSGETPTTELGTSLWNRYATRRPWQLGGELRESVTVTDIEIKDLDPTVEPDWRRTLSVRQVGWPTRCLFLGSFQRTPYELRERYGAIWPGVIANTAFYAAVLWLLSGGPFRLRRAIRKRRGLCPWCAYPMGESPVCTECGRELPGRTESPS